MANNYSNWPTSKPFNPYAHVNNANPYSHLAPTQYLQVPQQGPLYPQIAQQQTMQSTVQPVQYPQYTQVPQQTLMHTAQLNAILNQTNTILQTVTGQTRGHHEQHDQQDIHQKDTDTSAMTSGEKILKALDQNKQSILELKEKFNILQSKQTHEEDDYSDSEDEQNCTSYREKQLILFRSIEHQTCDQGKIRKITNKDTRQIQEAFKYWQRNNILTKHGNGYRLPDSLKGQKMINKNKNAYIKKLKHDLGPINIKKHSGHKRIKTEPIGHESESESNENASHHSDEDAPERKKQKIDLNELEKMKKERDEYKKEVARLRKEKTVLEINNASKNKQEPQNIPPQLPKDQNKNKKHEVPVLKDEKKKEQK